MNNPLLDWNNQPIPIKAKPDPNVNPCIAEHGPYPYDAERTKCKDCTHIVQLYAGRTVFKCLLRGVVGKTDHRSRWPACSKFEERTEGSIPFYRK